MEGPEVDAAIAELEALQAVGPTPAPVPASSAPQDLAAGLVSLKLFTPQASDVVRWFSGTRKSSLIALYRSSNIFPRLIPILDSESSRSSVSRVCIGFALQSTDLA